MPDSLPDMLKDQEHFAHKYRVPVEVHTHFMGVLPVERLVRYVEKHGFSGTASQADFGPHGADLIKDPVNKPHMSKSGFGLFFLLSAGLVYGYVQAVKQNKKAEAYYPVMVSFVAAVWMFHILLEHYGSAPFQLPYLTRGLELKTADFEDVKPPLRKGLIVKPERYTAEPAALLKILTTLKQQFPASRNTPAFADLERVARWAVGAMLMATKCTPFGDSYTVRDIFARYYGYEAYVMETLDFLVNDEEVRYAEQALGVGKLAGTFTAKNWGQWLSSFTEKWRAEHPRDPRANDGKKLIDVRWLITLPSSAYFQVGAKDIPAADLQKQVKLADLTKEKAKAEPLAAAAAMLRERADVIGIDVAQPEQPFDPGVAKANFKQLFQMVDDAARARGRKLIFRPHVGEGSGLKTEARTYLQELDEKSSRKRFFYEVDNIFRANRPAVTTLGGTGGEKGLEVFTMVLMHLSPQHFRIAAGIADDTWWGESSKEKARTYLAAFAGGGATWPPPEAERKQIEHFVITWLEGGTSPVVGARRSAAEIREFARANMKILLDALGEKRAALKQAWDPKTIVRFGHSTHVDADVVGRMLSLGVRSEGNLGSNGRTGSIQFDWMTGAPDPEVARDEIRLADYLGTWWNYNSKNLSRHPLWDFFRKVNLILSTDGQGVENTRLLYEYAAAAQYYDAKRAGWAQEFISKDDFLGWLKDSAQKHWDEILEGDANDTAAKAASGG